ncbi:Pfam:Drmip Hesp [Geosmithia morbida]|uniref:Pfam:Drmip Hesp n=1 Tax=Geosmithia morbida TaxID=1094350 RepID=A0A9P4YYE7_9HYPO|nr:Pfam:Drmip Hesp [Geosmithia morbida]KAF4124074.1 Pfam:Drmip Hesp [Geosmithia morbida]
MRSFATILALAATAIAQTAGFDPIYTPSNGEVIPAGSTYTVTWSAPAAYKSGNVAISLIGGADQGTLVPIANIASGVANSAESYQWSVSSDLGDAALYGLIFTLESDTSIYQYSMPFKIKKSDSKSASASVASAAPAAAASTTAAPIQAAEVVKTVDLGTTTVTDCPESDAASSTATAPPAVQTPASATATWTTKAIPSVVAPPVIPIIPINSTFVATPSGTPPVGIATPVSTPTEVPTAGAARLTYGSAALVGAAVMALAAF